MLFTLRRPSAITAGSGSKAESINTRFATFRAASLPPAIAMLQSDSLSASTSLTPSPVIATVCPLDLRASTSDFFISGVTRPNTVYFPAALMTSASVLSVEQSMYFSHPCTPTVFAMPATVCGLSPEIILMSTSCA